MKGDAEQSSQPDRCNIVMCRENENIKYKKYLTLLNIHPNENCANGHITLFIFTIWLGLPSNTKCEIRSYFVQ